MKPPLSRLRAGLVTLGVVFLVAVLGYCLAGWSLLDSVYMVVITLSTVGFREVHEMTPALQVFTILVIVVGVSTAFYIMGGLIQMMAEGEINRALGLRRASKEIERLSGHVIVCGFGRMGTILAGELSRQKRALVVIDNDPQQIAEATGLGYLSLHDDATEEEVLMRAGVERARAIVATLPKDADNVFITLTARDLNPKMQIIARGEFPSTEKKLIQAGANHVVLPAATGAMRMAALITRPSMVELAELIAGRGADMAIDELVIPEGSPLVGCTVRESNTRSRHGLLIMAIRHPTDDLVANPSADTAFQGGDSVLVMGRRQDIDRFRTEYEIL